MKSGMFELHYTENDIPATIRTHGKKNLFIKKQHIIILIMVIDEYLNDYEDREGAWHFFAFSWNELDREALILSDHRV